MEEENYKFAAQNGEVEEENVEQRLQEWEKAFREVSTYVIYAMGFCIFLKTKFIIQFRKLCSSIHLKLLEIARFLQMLIIL